MSNPFAVQSANLAVASEHRNVRLKRVGVLSTAIFLGVSFGLFGLLASLFMALVLLGQMATGINGGPGGAEVFGGFAIMIFVPISYGVMGFVGGALNAFCYNMISGLTGGIALELAPDPSMS